MEFAKKVQKQIYEQLGFTVNIGIANNKLCAKMASDFEKPYKIHTLYDYEIETKMYPLKIEELYGCGKKTSEKLKKLGIETIGDLALANEEVLRPIFKNMTVALINSARGINNDQVISDKWIPKGIGNEITLPKDISDYKELLKYLLDITENVALRLRKQKKYAHTVCVIIKTSDFKRKSHQKKFINATCNSEEIYEMVKEVFMEMYNEDKVRLIGVRLDNLTDKRALQASIFDESYKETSKLDDTVDEIKNKYGIGIIKKASLISSKEFKNLKD
jgi:DNA polymerase-4